MSFQFTIISKIQRCLDMDELLFVAHSETAGDLGFAIRTKYDLVTFMGVKGGMCGFARSQCCQI
jgi:hypothetical protein